MKKIKHRKDYDYSKELGLEVKNNLTRTIEEGVTKKLLKELDWKKNDVLNVFVNNLNQICIQNITLMKNKKIIIKTEKDLCIKCGRKIYKDVNIYQTKKGFVCYKCKK